MTRGRVKAVHVGRAKEADFPSPRADTAIDKREVAGPVRIHRHGLAGDEQADRRHHGGKDQAVYAYAYEDTAWWSDRLGRQLRTGVFGENISTTGLDVSGCLIGEIWRLGTGLVQVTSPRIPCRTFAGWIGVDHWVKAFADAGRPGAYLRVMEEGRVATDDPVVVVDRPTASISLAEVTRVYYGEWALLPRLVDAPGLATRWVALARQRITDRTLSRLPDHPVEE